MTKTPQPKTPLISLPNDFHTLSGQFLRGFTELEDMLDCHLFGVVGLNENQGRLMIGRSSFSAKIEMTLYACRTVSDQRFDEFNKLNTDYIRNLVRIRNMLAHSPYLGALESCESKLCRAKQRCYAFVGGRGDPHPDASTGSHKVERLCLDMLKAAYADMNTIQSILAASYPAVEGMRGERLQRFQTDLRPRRKKQQPKKKKSKK